MGWGPAGPGTNRDQGTARLSQDEPGCSRDEPPTGEPSGKPPTTLIHLRIPAVLANALQQLLNYCLGTLFQTLSKRPELSFAFGKNNHDVNHPQRLGSFPAEPMDTHMRPISEHTPAGLTGEWERDEAAAREAPGRSPATLFHPRGSPLPLINTSSSQSNAHRQQLFVQQPSRSRNAPFRFDRRLPASPTV